MELYEIEEKMKEAVNGIEKWGLEYAEARPVSWQLQEMRKVILATQMSKSEAKSVIAKEQEALQSPEYKQHLEGTAEAMRREHKAKAYLERYQAQFEACRSRMSLFKKQMEIT